MVETGQGWTDGLVYRTREGRRVIAEVSAAKIDADDQSIVIFCVRDITQRKRRSQQVQILNRVLRHNIRNDMNVIKGSAENILEDSPDEYAVEQSDRVVSTAESLIELSRKTRELHKAVQWQQDPRPIDVIETIESVRRQVLFEYPESSIETELPSEAWVVADDRIDRVFEEVCQNAIIHTEDPAPVVEVCVEKSSDCIDVAVIDHGPGISEQELAVLEGEETPLHHGSGLGLWLVNWIVNSVGGDLSFQANDPTGSVVTISLQRNTNTQTSPGDQY